MHRFFAERLDERSAVLPPEEEAHALRVLRLQPGDECQALLEDKLFAAEIAETAPRVVLRLGDELPSTEASVRVTLYQGIPKGEKMDFIAQKCTEAGVERIIPVAFSRCVAKWDGKDAAKKQARFQRIAAEAAKQSGRAVTPEIGLPVSVTKLCQELRDYDLALIPWEEERGNGIRQKWREETDVAIVIGPEGGISPEEAAQMRQAGGRTVTLGPGLSQAVPDGHSRLGCGAGKLRQTASSHTPGSFSFFESDAIVDA